MSGQAVCLAVGCLLLCSACSSEQWIHRYKKQDEFVYDYNRCEKEAFNKQQTLRMNLSSYAQDQFLERCLRREGWVRKPD